ncbi:MAG: PAS domain-containing sensor histidine kinase [Bacteroidota bacterium]
MEISDPKNRLQAIIDHVIDGIINIDGKGIIISLNPAAAEIFEYTQEELIGKNVKVLMPEPYFSEHDGYLKAYQETHEPKIIGKGREVVGRCKDGRTFPMWLSVSQVAFENEIIYSGVIHDLTPLKDTERQLEESRNRLNAIISTAVDGIITIDKHGIMETVNPAAAHLFGYEVSEMIHRNVRMLMPEPDHSSHDRYLNNYHQFGIKRIIGIGREVQGKRKDGSLFPFKLSISEVQLSDKLIFTGIIHDITQEKAAEAQILRINEELEERVHERTEKLADVVNKMLAANQNLEKEITERRKAEERLIESQKRVRQSLEKEKQLSELKSRFVSMASHEFRTPLSTILSSASLIEKYAERGEYDKQHKHIGRIKSAVHNLTNILNDFLSISKLEEGKFINNPSTFDFVALAHDIIEQFQGILKPGQVIQFEHSGPTEVFLDQQFCKNIMINLLSNASKYSGPDSPIEWRSIANDRLFIWVKDHGIGIPESDKKHMFERFFRAKNATNIQGTGLGLNIIHRYLELMDGHIDFESELEVGTTFKVELPIKQNIES